MCAEECAEVFLQVDFQISFNHERKKEIRVTTFCFLFIFLFFSFSFHSHKSLTFYSLSLSVFLFLCVSVIASRKEQATRRLWKTIVKKLIRKRERVATISAHDFSVNGPIFLYCFVHSVLVTLSRSKKSPCSKANRPPHI